MLARREIQAPSDLCFCGCQRLIYDAFRLKLEQTVLEKYREVVGEEEVAVVVSSDIPTEDLVF